MILIVDDDNPYTEDLKRVLTRIGGYAEVEVAHTGKKALEFVKTTMPRVIVLDMMIPYDENDILGASLPQPSEESRGMRVARELRELAFDLGRVVAFTALPDESVRKALEALGIRELLTKPTLTTEVLDTIRRVYDRD